jgi:hypothetical protein
VCEEVRIAVGCAYLVLGVAVAFKLPVPFSSRIVLRRAR